MSDAAVEMMEPSAPAHGKLRVRWDTRMCSIVGGCPSQYSGPTTCTLVLALVRAPLTVHAASFLLQTRSPDQKSFLVFLQDVQEGARSSALLECREVKQCM